MTLRSAALMLLALMVVPLLVRNGLIIPAHVPLDPNEGWNAAHALAARLYPSPDSLMINNYPPLSFYLVRAVTSLTGDAIVAGRIIAMASFLLVCVGIAAVARGMGGNALLAALFFSATLLVASSYVGIDDPQMLGHAAQIMALLLLLRGRMMAAVLIFAISLFVKHNLLALPLASLWLCIGDRRAAGRFIMTGVAAVCLGLIAFRLVYGVNLWTQLASPRLSSFANLQTAAANLWWMPLLPLIAAFGVGKPWRGFCLVYAGIALLLGLAFSIGDGVDTNVFFDLTIACALIVGLTRWRVPATASVMPLAAGLVLTFGDNNSAYIRSFANQSGADIAFLRSRPGPALCDQLSLCLWAGKSAEVDVFNIGEAIKAGARDPAVLINLIRSHHFAVLQLEDLDALGPQVRDAITHSYRADHTDDNGTFFTPAL